MPSTAPFFIFLFGFFWFFFSLSPLQVAIAVQDVKDFLAGIVSQHQMLNVLLLRLVDVLITGDKR
jgi:hypothetical protein